VINPGDLFRPLSTDCQAFTVVFSAVHSPPRDRIMAYIDSQSCAKMAGFGPETSQILFLSDSS
jgi:hypothetical protein